MTHPTPDHALREPHPGGMWLYKYRLVPVEVFGVDDYGLCDAVRAWSDCNRAVGRIFRIDDVEEKYRNPDETMGIYVPETSFDGLFVKRWGDEFESDDK